jgi:hypothetical protein
MEAGLALHCTLILNGEAVGRAPPPQDGRQAPENQRLGSRDAGRKDERKRMREKRERSMWVEGWDKG